MNDRSEIRGSSVQHSDFGLRGALAPQQKLTATIVLRRKAGATNLAARLLSGNFLPVSREDAAQEMGADPDDLAAVRAFAAEYGLQVEEADAAKRRVKVKGSVESLDRAFGIQIGTFGDHTSYEGPLTVPSSLDGIIMAVLGLDNRSVARAKESAES